MQSTGGPIQLINLTDFGIQSKVQLSILREDLNHPNIENGSFICGNKWRKLKYNIQYVLKNNLEGMLTFGGAFSNHLYAVAAAGKAFGFRTTGIVRGEEWQNKSNPTLQFCLEQNMQLHFWSRKKYRNKEKETVCLQETYPDFLVIPEGGTNALAIKGVQEIWENPLDSFSTIAVPIGTGGTFTGLISGSKGKSTILGFSTLKLDFVPIIQAALQTQKYPFSNWEVNNDFHFGGFAKFNDELISFIQKFKAVYNIQLEPLYTAKMMYGIFDGIQKGLFKENSNILAIHTGGLQGLAGFEARHQIRL